MATDRGLLHGGITPTARRSGQCRIARVKASGKDRCVRLQAPANGSGPCLGRRLANVMPRTQMIGPQAYWHGCGLTTAAARMLSRLLGCYKEESCLFYGTNIITTGCHYKCGRYSCPIAAFTDHLHTMRHGHSIWIYWSCTSLKTVFLLTATPPTSLHTWDCMYF